MLLQTLKRYSPMMQAAKRPTPFMAMGSIRSFGITKYQFDDEDWKPSITQVSEDLVKPI